MPKFRRTRNATHSTDEEGLTVTFELALCRCGTFHDGEKCPTETEAETETTTSEQKQSQK